MTILVLEGNIGVTKTTIGNAIVEKLRQISIIYSEISYKINHNQIFKFVFIPEDLNPEKLTEFYNNPATNSFEFQKYMLQKSIENYQRAKAYSSQGFLVLLDRNLIGYTVFLETLYKQKCLTTEEYEHLINEIKKINPMYHKIIHIQDTPFACLKRIKQRGRPYEQDITIDYILEIDMMYNKVLSEYDNVHLLYISTVNHEHIFDTLIKPYINQSLHIIS